MGEGIHQKNPTWIVVIVDIGRIEADAESGERVQRMRQLGSSDPLPVDGGRMENQSGRTSEVQINSTFTILVRSADDYIYPRDMT